MKETWVAEVKRFVSAYPSHPHLLRLAILDPGARENCSTIQCHCARHATQQRTCKEPSLKWVVDSGDILQLRDSL